MSAGVKIKHDKTRKKGQKAIGKDEVASSNLAISSRSPEHVVSMGSGFSFCLPRHYYTFLSPPAQEDLNPIVRMGRWGRGKPAQLQRMGPRGRGKTARWNNGLVCPVPNGPIRAQLCRPIRSSTPSVVNLSVLIECFLVF